MTQFYDVVLSSPFSNYHFFAHRMRELCGQMNLSFFVVDDVWVKEFTQKVESEEIGVRVLFDLTANQTIENDPYLKLAREVKRRRGHVIDDPDMTATTAHKGFFHQKLLERNIPVPETVVVNRSEVKTFKITAELRARVGTPFVVKPAWGDSGVGVILDGVSEDALLASAEQTPNSDAFLIQKRLNPRPLGNHMGWFRLFYICGEVIPCWWDPSSHQYHLVTPAQQKQYALTPLKRIMKRIAQISKMKKFTSEICLSDADGKFYVVDYINADPDMNPQSFYPNGVPDEVVRHVVWLLFYEAMHLIKKGHGFFDEELIEFDTEHDWLERRKVEQRIRESQ